MRILLVEDDEMLGDGIKIGLEQNSHTVDWVTNGEAARMALNTESFDALVLDLHLPKRSGLSVLQDMRQRGINTPVLILTAYETIEDRVKGLDTGADDYMVKPFDMEELNARLRALIRRRSERGTPYIEYKGITLDPAAQTVYIDEKPANISRREFSLLEKMLENPGKVLNRDTLIQTLYGWDEEIDSNALEVHIHNLRKKLGDRINIKTVRGVGYLIE